jgi:hypothetical protein
MRKSKTTKYDRIDGPKKKKETDDSDVISGSKELEKDVELFLSTIPSSNIVIDGSELEKKENKKSPNKRSRGRPTKKGQEFEEKYDLSYSEEEESGGSSGTENHPINNKKAGFTSRWLQENYELREGVSIPRSVLFAQYLESCARVNQEPVNAATFGKIIRAVWPNVSTRRLGNRGNSKYHYYGISLRTRRNIASATMVPPVRFVPIAPPIPRKRGKKAFSLIIKSNNSNSPVSVLNYASGNSSVDSSIEGFLSNMTQLISTTLNTENIPQQISLNPVYEFTLVYKKHLGHLYQAATGFDFQKVSIKMILMNILV